MVSCSGTVGASREARLGLPDNIRGRWKSPPQARVRSLCRMSTTAKFDSERFRSDAQKYAAYLETPEGRLRLDLAFANVREFLPVPAVDNSLRVLDVGCG